MRKETKLTETEKDELSELGNVGAGRASRYLSELVEHRVDIGVPEAEIVDIDGENIGENMFHLKPEDEITAVVIPLKNSGGMIIFTFEQEGYQEFLDLWNNSTESEENQDNFLGVSKKVGDFYLEAVNQLLELDLESDQPKLISLGLKALTIHSTSQMNVKCGPEKNCLMAINTDVKIGDSESNLTMLLDHDQAEEIVEAMEEQL